MVAEFQCGPAFAEAPTDTAISPRFKWYPRMLLLFPVFALFYIPYAWPFLLTAFVLRSIYYHIFVLPKHNPPKLEIQHKYVVTRDSTRVHYYVLGEDPTNGDRTIVLANGVGCLFIYWRYIIDHLVSRGYRFVSWDQRGQFMSEAPSRTRNLSMRDFALDCAEIMDDMGMRKCAVLLGWSTGVQVGLEFAALFPERLGRLVVTNGNHGQTFTCVLQPLMRVPPMKQLIHYLIEYVIRPLCPYREPILNFLTRNYGWIKMFTARPWATLALEPSIEDYLIWYVNGLLGSGEGHFMRYFRVCQELDAHSVYHLLPEIETPTTLVSGCLDFLTPCFQMYEMEALMPNVRHVNLLFHSHFVIFEHPQILITCVDEALEDYSAEMDVLYAKEDEHLQELRSSESELENVSAAKEKKCAKMGTKTLMSTLAHGLRRRSVTGA